MIQLPLRGGRYAIGVEWLPVRPPNRPPHVCFYINEQRVREDQVTRDAHRATLRISVPDGGAARLAWVCRSWRARHDSRALGLPLRRITWCPQPPRDGARDSPLSADE